MTGAARRSGRPRVDEFLRRAVLHDAAVLEHQHPVGDLAPSRAGARSPARRSASTVSSARCTNRSLGMSSDDVASSRINTAGSARNARANATNCRCPADSRPPRLATSVSYPSGSASTNRSAPTADGRRPHLRVGGVGLAQPDVVGDGAVEDQGLLRHRGDVAAQIALRQVAQVDPVEGDRPRSGRRTAR